MATSTNTKISLHSRSKSEPSSPHPLTLQFDENLQRLKASETISSSSSLSLICQNLEDLQDLHGCIDKMLQLPIIKQALAQECCKKRVDELLEEGSLRLLDVSSAAKEALLQSKDSIKELQSAIRRRRRGRKVIVPIEEFLSLRKKVKKAIQKTLENLRGYKKDVTLTSLNKECYESVSMIRNLKEAELITLSLLQSMLCFMYGSLGQSKYIKWSMVSKFMQPKRVVCDSGESISNTNEFEKLDMKLQFLLCHKSWSIVSIENFQNQLENLELCVQDLEVEIENLQRGLIRMRVSLLNIFNH